MKIGVVSDTHSLELPAQMLQDFRGVDLILHAGDFCSWRDVEQLQKIKEVCAVHGNMDEPNICRFFPRRQILKLERLSIGMFHGEGRGDVVLEKVKQEFVNDNLDCVIFGHSHQAFCNVEGQRLYFNPGSPNDAFSSKYCSYGILEVIGKKVRGRIIKVK